MQRRQSSKAEAIDPLQQAALTERCIVVNENDVRVGSASKLDCHKVQSDGSLMLHRAFSVFLFNSRGEILLQKRAASKITFPSHVTNACCSHPIEDFPEELEEGGGLGVKAAARRRLHYELGIPPDQIDFKDVKYLTRIHYQASDDGVWGEHEIDYILFLQKDVTLKPNQNEVSEVKYVGRDEFSKYLGCLKDPLTPWFRLIAHSRLPFWWDNLSTVHLLKDHTTIQRFG